MALLTTFVDSAGVRSVMSMPEAIDAVREAYVAAAHGSFAPIPRIGTTARSVFAMLAERIGSGPDDRPGQCVKVVSYHEENPQFGRPVVQGLVLWFNGETGEAPFVLDGAAVTALRTGAASGVATDLLASPDASVLAVIGTGAAAPDQVRAVCAVRSIREVRIAGRDFDKAQRLARKLSQEFQDIAIQATQTVADAVAHADVICTATTSRQALFGRSQIRSDVHINAIGAFSAAMCEIGSDVISSARLICVDDKAALAECGDLAGPLRRRSIVSDDVLLIGHAIERGTTASGGITIFKSIGIAAQDWAIAARFESLYSKPAGV
ncbi:MAG TPA: hypothetical protein VFE17_07105 [Candidatus Baltobacteraceae bacterium]|nr:hypothetical protein [Candidatus Baltobacteraceae bacterium]